MNAVLICQGQNLREELKHPDQKSIAYMAVMDTHSQVGRIREYIKPYQFNVTGGTEQ